MAWHGERVLRLELPVRLMNVKDDKLIPEEVQTTNVSQGLSEFTTRLALEI